MPRETTAILNRQGEAFDKGETFSGVPYETGVEAAEKLKRAFPDTENLAPFALKWILQFNEVSCIIPGASKPEQVYSNVSASELPNLTPDQLREVKRIYDEMVHPHVHHLW